MRRVALLVVLMTLAATACRKTTTPPPPAPPETINGWILMDSDPDALRRAFDAAARYGVNHVQLSQNLIMNIDDVLGDDAETQQRVERLNLAIQLAHERGIKAYIWAHEISPLNPDVCYAPATDTSSLGEACSVRSRCVRALPQSLAPSSACATVISPSGSSGLRRTSRSTRFARSSGSSSAGPRAA